MPRFGTEPEWAEDTAHTYIDVTVSLRDRLRVLLLGKFSMQVVVHTEHVIGRTLSDSMFIAPRFRQPKHGGYVTEELPAPATEEVQG